VSTPAFRPDVLPDVFVLGAPKCGTTAVTRYLEAHPEVFVADRKDIHFFGRDLGFRNRAREDRAAYLARFSCPIAESAKVRVESSVWYLYSQSAAAEMTALNASARGVALIRHPVPTMHALWSQLRLNGLGDEDLTRFSDALDAEADRAAGRRIPSHTPLPEALLYRRVVCFSEQLQRARDAFGEDGLHIIVQEEMKADTAGTLRALFKWLGVSADLADTIDTRPVNTAKSVRSEGLRRWLQRVPPGLKDIVPRDLRKSASKHLRSLNSKHARRAALDPALRERLLVEMAHEVVRIEEVLGRSIPAWHV